MRRRWRVVTSDCVEWMASMDENSVDAIVTDPPYGLKFMGKDWDDMGHGSAQQAWHYRWTVEALRVLKPGGHLLAFGGTRTYHRLASAVEDAGFEIRDQIQWLYGTGFPKSLNVSKAIDKAAGAGRERIPVGGPVKRMIPGADQDKTGSWIKDNEREYQPGIEIPATEDAAQWEGWGTALKPAHEPIVVARKPLIGTVAKNVLEWGTGGLNIDASRVGTSGATRKGSKPSGESYGIYGEGINGKVDIESLDYGRWPANVILDDEAGAMLDAQTGETGNKWKKNYGNQYADESRQYEGGSFGGGGYKGGTTYADRGGASRFFYSPKASNKERFTYLHCDCETVKLSAWVRRDRNRNDQTDGTSPNPGTSVKESTDDLSSSTSTSGNKKTGQSQLDTASTTSMETSRTTGSKTSSLSPQQNTNESTQDANSGTVSGGSHAKSVATSNQSIQIIGTSRPKAGRSMGVVAPVTSARLLKGSVCEECGSEVKAEQHPTQKPVAPMRYLIRLVTPPGGVVLDPFVGSGSTGIAAIEEGFRFIGIDVDEAYIEIAKARIRHSVAEVKGK